MRIFAFQIFVCEFLPYEFSMRIFDYKYFRSATYHLPTGFEFDPLAPWLVVFLVFGFFLLNTGIPRDVVFILVVIVGTIPIERLGLGLGKSKVGIGCLPLV